MCHDVESVACEPVQKAEASSSQSLDDKVDVVLRHLFADGALPEAYRLPLSTSYRERVRAAVSRALS